MTSTTQTKLPDETATSQPSHDPAQQPTAPAPVDPRRKALLRFAMSISALTVAGHLVLGFEQAPITPIVTMLVAYGASILLEAIDARAYQRPPEFAGGDRNFFYFLLPPHIAALACALLLYADNLLPYVFATLVAVGGKYVLRQRINGRLRHYMNPSNLGIVVLLLVNPTVGFVPPYQFLNNTDGFIDVAIPLLILMLGTMLNAKLTKKTPLILGWVGGYVLVALLRTLFFDDVLLSALGMMTGVAFVLFTNYMITDPGTTPVKPGRQVLFGLATAGFYGVYITLEVSYAIFFCVVTTCLARGLLLRVGELRKRRAN